MNESILNHVTKAINRDELIIHSVFLEGGREEFSKIQAFSPKMGRGGHYILDSLSPP